MAIPDFQTLMLPVLRHARDGDIRTSTLIEKVEAEFQLSDEERDEMLPSGRQRTIANRTHWAVAYLFKAGLLERVSRGVYRITSEGVTVLGQNPDKIDLVYLTTHYESIRQFRTKANDKGDPKPDTASGGDTPEQVIDTAIAEIDSILTDEVLTQVHGLHFKKFEFLIIDLMTAMGYGAQGSSEHVGEAGDGGIDGVITEDKLGLDVVYLQAKRYAPENKIGPEQVRGFIGALSIRRASKGVFVTTSGFTTAAENEAKMSGQRVILIDGQRLAELMIRYGVGVRTVRTVEIREIDLNYFEDA